MNIWSLIAGGFASSLFGSLFRNWVGETGDLSNDKDDSSNSSDTDIFGNPIDRSNDSFVPSLGGYSLGPHLWDWNVADQGSLFGNYTGELTQSEMANMVFNHNEAQMQRNWEEDLANTTYQRGVADMQAAGLNPALAYGQGGDPTPNGATASSSAGNRGALDFLGLVMNMILGTKSLEIQSAKTQSEIDVNNATANKINTETPWIDVLNALLSGKTEAEIENIHSNTDLTKEQIENARVARDKMNEEISLMLKEETEIDAKIDLMYAQAFLAEAQEWQIYRVTDSMVTRNLAEANSANANARQVNLVCDSGQIEAIAAKVTQEAKQAEIKTAYETYVINDAPNGNFADKAVARIGRGLRMTAGRLIK